MFSINLIVLQLTALPVCVGSSCCVDWSSSNCFSISIHKSDDKAIESVKQTPAYRNRLKALEFERTGGIANKKKGHKQADKKAEEEVSNEVELQIHGVEKPSVWRLYGVQFILLPYSIGKVLTWEICWFWRYWIKKLPYAWEYACYLTQTSLKIPAGTWKNIDEPRKDDLVTETP
uniref:Uncharacterized protein n=1 Tax=Setaria italica TaxID=4555 RepID=K3YNT5_SETIT